MKHTCLVRAKTLKFLVLAFLMIGCNKFAKVTEEKAKADADVFPDELVNFTPYEKNPVFSGTGADTWDENIRERGYILKEDDGYHMWYTGFKGEDEKQMLLGYATSP